MRHGNNVRHSQQRGVFRQRLLFENVQSGGVNNPFLQRGNQRLFVHYRAAPGVNKDGAGLHFGELFFAEQMISLVGQR